MRLELSYPDVCPFDGQVVGKHLEGAYAAGVEVFAFLDSRKWYVWPTFTRELQNISPGMRAGYLCRIPIVFGNVRISPAVQSQDNNVEVKVCHLSNETTGSGLLNDFLSGSEIENPDPGGCGWALRP